MDKIIKGFGPVLRYSAFFQSMSRVTSRAFPVKCSPAQIILLVKRRDYLSVLAQHYLPAQDYKKKRDILPLRRLSPGLFENRYFYSLHLVFFRFLDWLHNLTHFCVLCW